MDYKKLNNKGMLARDYLIMLVIFSLFTGIAALIVADLSSEGSGYNVTGIVDEDFEDTYNRINELEGTIGQMGNATKSKEGLGILGGVAEGFFGATISVIELTFSSFSIVRETLVAMMYSFGIPPIIANLAFSAIMMILTIIIVFVVVSSLTKTKM
jgi:hypothetical protein